MTTTDLQTIDQPAEPLKNLTVREHEDQIKIIQDVLLRVMKQDVHYGVIPGTSNMSLLKPGAEKILATFHLACDPEIIDKSTDTEVRYLVRNRLTHASGRFVGVGIGECSSYEAKYKWRKPVCQEEWDEAPVDRRRNKWVKYGNKPAERNPQIMTEPADIANTILKMAKKRALVDACLTATAASDIFAQAEDGGEPNTRDSYPIKPARHAPKAGRSNASIDSAPLIKALEAEANNGTEALLAKWGTYSQAQQDAVGSVFFQIKKQAEGKANAAETKD